MHASRKPISSPLPQFPPEMDLAARLECWRNGLLGLWAATVLDLDDQQAYADALMQLAGQGEHALLQRLRLDFENAGIAVTDAVLQDRMVALLQSAAQDLRAQK